MDPEVENRQQEEIIALQVRAATSTESRALSHIHTEYL